MATDAEDWIPAFAGMTGVPWLGNGGKPFLRDPKDELLLELAIKAQCDHIVTYNQRDFEGSTKLGIAVVTPKQLLQMIGVVP